MTTNSPNTTEKTSETFDAYEARYRDTVNQAVGFSGLDVDFFTRVKADYIADLARAEFGDLSGVRLLDVGCGIGNFHPLLTRHFGHVHGVDISASSIERARQANPDVAYSVYEGHRLPYEDASMDVAMAVCVMHHVPPEQWPEFSAEMHRVLRPGGVALIFEHNPLNPLSVHVVNNCPFDEDAVLLRAPKTEALFREAGFSEVSRRFILTVPAFNDTIRKVDTWFSRVPLGAQYYVRARKS